MNVYEQKKIWKILLFIAAVLIGLSSLWYTGKLVNQLSEEERKKVELWAEATRQLAAAQENTDLSFILNVIIGNRTIPVILADDSGKALSFVNIDSVKALQPGFLEKQLAIMRSEHDPIEINVYGNVKQYIYYKDSYLLVQLRYYPMVQLFIISLFILVAYFAFSASRKAEQNQVWVGMSKETAHQLGTPVSSLLAWADLLREKGENPALLEEMRKDIVRLESITERFSKIGSPPDLEHTPVNQSVTNAVRYITSRTSESARFDVSVPDSPVMALLHPPLFEWVLENLLRNSVDAINGKGNISIVVSEDTQNIYIDISDDGKGIPSSKHKTIFKPGYTTKERGWGLGLSLSKRIIEEYHKGKIFVKHSEPGKGTAIRIMLKKG
ncbi:MAG: HAMP domain-containing histidine kinase [Bacteroidetes bacterium]|nr:HAMP domain-containing histidine kinase [Bacteroidota bacterium]